MARPPVVTQLVETLVVGGAEALAVRLANGRAAGGSPTGLYALQPHGPLRERVLPAVRFRELGVERASVKNPLAFAASLQRGRGVLGRQLAADGVEIVQSHLPEANLWTLLLTGPQAPAVIATIHNNQEFYLADRQGGARQALRRRAYRWLVRRCAAVVTVSAGVKDSLVADLALDGEQAAKLVVVPNGVAVPVLADDHRQAVRQELGLAAHEFLLLGAGRLTRQKNFIDLVDLAARLQADGLPVRVAIAGEGEDRPLLADRIAGHGLQERVQLLGVRHDLERLFQAADVFVLSSLWEGLPLVMLEAMACACPVAAYAIGGTADILTDGHDGILAPPGDVAALGQAIGRWLADDEARRLAGRRGRDLVERRHSFQGVLDRLEELYTEVAARRRHPGATP